jgi:hypothetical protein
MPRRRLVCLAHFGGGEKGRSTAQTVDQVSIESRTCEGRGAIVVILWTNGHKSHLQDRLQRRDLDMTFGCQVTIPSIISPKRTQLLPFQRASCSARIEW